jgi:hypothetical protein
MVSIAVAAKVAAILDPALPQTETISRQLEGAAPAMGLKLQILKASTSDEINAAKRWPRPLHSRNYPNGGLLCALRLPPTS